MNIAAMEDATEKLLQMGVRVLNAHLLGKTETEHVARLLALMDPPTGATVLDAGCGVGEVARLMAASRPDLQFILLNISEMQLSHCPSGMHTVLADFASTGLEDESVDVVMFNYSLCHSLDVPAALREARRVLREGGVLFINDMVRHAGDNRVVRALFSSSFHFPHHVIQWAEQSGFVANDLQEHESTVTLLRDIAGAQVYDLAYADTLPATMRFIRRTIGAPIESAFARHKNIAFQFSGGRDSTAALYLLRPYWDRMTVYHLDTGDQFPETRAIVAAVEEHVPVVRIISDAKGVRELHGMPSDVVPVDNTAFGRHVSGREVLLQSRYDCCWRALMLPMHERMQADGVTLIVRGQRDEDYAYPPTRSGAVGQGLEVLYPVQGWDTAQVDAYIRDNGLPLAPFYEQGMPHGSDCMGCTAWWDDGRMGYLRENHPVVFDQFEANMKVIRIEVDRQWAMLDR